MIELETAENIASVDAQKQGQTPPASLGKQELLNDIPPSLANPVPPEKAKEEASVPVPKKVWTRSDIVRSVKLGVTLPALYPNVEPWIFEMRLKLSVDAEERRADYMALSPSEQTVKEQEQNLDELCDLLMSLPKGFGDLVDNGQGPGNSFKDYVMLSDETTKQTLFTIVRGAVNLYGRKTSPHEFLGKV